MEVLLAKPRGFCAGVDRAIAIVERALALQGAPIYVRHEIVHNKYVVDDLRAKGAVFVEELDEVPAGSTVIFSAHGVSLDVRREAEARGLKVFDATCPLVTKVHVEVAKMREAGREVVMIGHEGHPEAEGTMGQSSDGMYLVETEEVKRRDPTNQRLPALLESLLQLDRRAVWQLRDQPEIPVLHAMEIEALAEAGDERVERHLQSPAGGNRRGPHAMVPVEQDDHVVPVVRRSVVDGEHVAVQLERLYRWRLTATRSDRKAYEERGSRRTTKHGLS